MKEKLRAVEDPDIIQQALDHVGIGLYRIDAETGRFLYVNPTACRIIGYTQEEMLQRCVPDIDENFPLNKFLANNATARQQGGLTFQTEQRAKDGRLVPTEISIKYFVDGPGGTHQLVGFVRDLTDRKRLEEELRHSEERFRLAMDAAQEGIWDWNLASGAVYYSPGYAAMLGFDAGELAPTVQTWIGLLDPAEADEIVGEVGRALNEKGDLTIEFRLRRKDGSYRWMLSRGKVVARDDQGRPLRAVGTHVDITELKEARLNAEAAVKAKSAFIANMSHEIRTPLNGIIGLAGIIRKKGLSPDQDRQMQRLETVSHHLLGLLNDVLDLARIENGHFELYETPFDGQVLADTLASILKEEVASKGLRLDIAPVRLPARLLGDGVRLRQCYLSLVGNAVKFTQRGGVTLRIELQAEDTDSALLRFAVEDTGIGISDEALSRLFQPFEQADNSLTRPYGGAGLGLALVKRLSRLMGGDAGARSTPGVGSTFWFTARLRKAGPAVAFPAAWQDPETIKASLRARWAGHHVLVVEDDAVTRMIAEMLLMDVGLVVDLAEDGLQAVQKAQAQRYDLVLMDLRMPHMNGNEATREIRQTLAHGMPIIAVTSSVFEEDREACMAAGMDDFLVKPFDIDVFYDTILHWLENPPVRSKTVQAPQ